jgi:hypothetical protein
VGKKFTQFTWSNQVGEDGDVLSGICRILVADRRLWCGGHLLR